MPFTLANTERGTIAIPCPKCNALLETSLDKFVLQNDYRLGVRCPRCQAGFTVRLEPEQESQPTQHAPDTAFAAIKAGEPAPAPDPVKPAGSQAAPVM